jgi:hypothetical protein
MNIIFIAELRSKLANKPAPLSIAASNPDPVREPQYPSTWVLYSSGGQTVITITRDDRKRPHVACKQAA